MDMEIVWDYWEWLNTDLEHFHVILLCVVVGIIGAFSRFYEDGNKKKWLATVSGVIIILFAGGLAHFWHIVLSTVIGTYIIVSSSKRSCHKTISVFMCTYITVYRIYQCYYNTAISVNATVNLIQMMMVVKLIGVGFEINKTDIAKEAILNGTSKLSDEEEIVEPTLSDLLHYAFSCYGVILSPYVTYRTYRDYLTQPFSRVVGIKFARRKFTSAIIFSVIYLVIENYSPLEYSLSTEFEESSFFYQTRYIFAQFQRFIIRLTCGFMWGELGATAAGLGAYPSHCDNKAAHGPTERYSLINKLDTKEAAKMEYDFKAVISMDLLYIEATPWMSVQARNWNKTIQYFLWKSVYQKLPNTGAVKGYRILITVILSSLWHGLQPGFFFGLFVVPTGVLTERIYKTILTEHISGWKADIILVYTYLFRVYLSGFATIVFDLRDFGPIYHFLSSAYFMPYIVHICVHIIGVVLLSFCSSRKKARLLKKH